jgi:F-type H+/Na+-transporting ATPase subunit beta
MWNSHGMTYRKVNDALKIVQDADLVFEVQQQLGDGVVRTIAMGSTDGLKRGLQAMNTPARLSRYPLARSTLGRIMDVLGAPELTNAGPVEAEELLVYSP